MNSNEKQEHEFLLKELSRTFVKNQLEQLKNKNKDNNSFIYLEGNTLNMLIVYLLMENERNNQQTSENVQSSIPEELINALDLLMSKNKTEFEDILSILKEKL
ncbi:hypothetical protein JOC75_001131 [Metabacillus crassostreae]|uniref:hypothetical protein n=1 Tax=Metabacillus crassostreae TaxID=929098 RepID=UPI00195C01EA|nr:hypothetical protein [Metabacillus crassostreae]MBM7603161.1 hypothetical protein [Metabacillus crassostreae]